jgi:hypothetical protein
MGPALDRPKRDGIDHQPRLEPGLDREKPTHFAKHQAITIP